MSKQINSVQLAQLIVSGMVRQGGIKSIEQWLLDGNYTASFITQHKGLIEYLQKFNDSECETQRYQLAKVLQQSYGIPFIITGAWVRKELSSVDEADVSSNKWLIAAIVIMFVYLSCDALNIFPW